MIANAIVHIVHLHRDWAMDSQAAGRLGAALKGPGQRHVSGPSQVKYSPVAKGTELAVRVRAREMCNKMHTPAGECLQMPGIGW